MGNYWRESLRLQPSQVPVLLQTAWVLATSREASVRNGAEAVELATRAIQLSGGESARLLDVLAAAYAEAGRFSEAVATARRALAMVSSADTPLFRGLQDRVGRYQSGVAFHESERAPVAGSVSPE